MLEGSAWQRRCAHRCRVLRGRRSGRQRAHAVHCQRAFDEAEELAQRPPEAFADSAAGVLAEPGRAHRLAVPPDAASARVGLIVRAAQVDALAERLGAATGVEHGKHRGLLQPQRRDAGASGDTGQDGRPSGGHLSGDVEQDPADEEVRERRHVGATLHPRVEEESGGGFGRVPGAGEHRAGAAGGFGLGGNDTAQQRLDPRLVERGQLGGVGRAARTRHVFARSRDARSYPLSRP